MKFISAAHMRKLDEDTIANHGVKGEVLMARAGRGIARETLQLLRVKGTPIPTILLVAGKGNNGGDVFVVARLLHQAGCRVQVWLAAAESDVKGDAKVHLELMKSAGVSCTAIPEESGWTMDRLNVPLVDLVIDGLLGTGASGAPKGVVAAAIRLVNQVGRECSVVAVDIPSGLNADTGVAENPCVVADFTFTLGLPKKAFAFEDSWDFTGSIELIDIGIPEALIAAVDSDESLEMITEDFVREVLPRRPRQTNKGTYGRALLIGGARGFSGAIGLAARAAVASGAGLVTVFTPRSVAASVSSGCQEAMVMPADETTAGTLASPMIETLGDLKRFSSILIGPGMGNNPDTLRILRDLLRTARAPLIVDADALNVVEGRGHWLDNSSSQSIVTPHPGEMARLLGVDLMTVLSDRRNVAHNAAEITGGLVALKGAGTIIADGKRRLINLTGNPGMATGGTGDVLAGMIAGFVAQGLSGFDALAVSVYLHGKAGDLAAVRSGQHGLKAGDIIEMLPGAMEFVL
jgi:NAD(P)H-hydrate epimerase